MDTTSTAPNFAARAALPEVMFEDDVGIALRMPPHMARDAMRAGLCGPHIVLGTRLAVLRESFLQSLRDQEILPPDPPLPRN